MSQRVIWIFSNYLLVGLLAVAISGCGGSPLKPGRKTGEVTGTITLNDQPLKGGVVCLTDEADGDTAMGTIGADGKFVVKYRLGTQVPTGKYKITVGPAPLAHQPTPQELMQNREKYNVPNPIPVGYRTPQATSLSAEIKEGTNTLTLAMKGKS